MALVFISAIPFFSTMTRIYCNIKGRKKNRKDKELKTNFLDIQFSNFVQKSQKRFGSVKSGSKGKDEMAAR